MSDYLPKEMVLEILHRLPSKTLVRCTSVCKAWNKIIKSDAFKSSHLQHYLSNPTLSLLFPYHVPNYIFKERSLCSHGIINSTTNEFPTIEQVYYTFHVVNTVNGVICFSHDSSSCVVLWNPLIERQFRLPTPFFTFNKLERCYYTPSTIHVGFGFDSKTNDYKVVRIIYPKPYDHMESSPLVELYSLNEGAWRIIDASFIDAYRIVKCVSSQCFLHGNVHWLASEVTHSPIQYCVLMFNVEEENFNKTRLPPELTTLSSSHDYLSISVINGCLSLIEHVYEQTTTRVCNVWIKRGHAESWNKMYTINEQTGVYQRVLLASRTSDEIFEVPFRGQFVPLWLFGSHGQKITRLGVPIEDVKSFFFSEYTPSLVLFDRENVPIQFSQQEKRLFAAIFIVDKSNLSLQKQLLSTEKLLPKKLP